MGNFLFLDLTLAQFYTPRCGKYEAPFGDCRRAGGFVHYGQLFRNLGKGRFANHPHRAAAPAIPLSRRSDNNLNFRLSRWTDALRLFVIVYCVSRFV
jgi:hypothetical protein